MLGHFFELVHPYLDEETKVIIYYFHLIAGRLITMLAGEGHREDLEDILEAGIDVYSGLGMLDTTPLPVVRCHMDGRMFSDHVYRQT